MESELVGELIPWITGLTYTAPTGRTHQAWAWVAPTCAVQDEVGCYEGQAMRLVPLDEAARLELAGWTELTLPTFLLSPLHARLADTARRLPREFAP